MQYYNSIIKITTTSIDYPKIFFGSQDPAGTGDCGRFSGRGGAALGYYR